jgi:hypothetical protein
MIKDQVEKKLQGMFFLAPIKVMKTDGSSSSVQIPKGISIGEEGIFFSEGGERVDVCFDQIADIVTLAEVHVIPRI